MATSAAAAAATWWLTCDSFLWVIEFSAVHFLCEYFMIRNIETTQRARDRHWEIFQIFPSKFRFSWAWLVEIGVRKSEIGYAFVHIKKKWK